jgi:hypothetical protein
MRANRTDADYFAEKEDDPGWRLDPIKGPEDETAQLHRPQMSAREHHLAVNGQSPRPS